MTYTKSCGSDRHCTDPTKIDGHGKRGICDRPTDMYGIHLKTKPRRGKKTKKRSW